ncbi:MAG: serine hydrolase domain-containing protein [Gemmataceae bacterium]
MRRLAPLTVLLLVFAQRLLAQAPGLDAAKVSAVEAAVGAEMQRQKLIGVAVAVVADGQLAYARGFGFADRERYVPVTGATLFRWASVSKPVTAIAAMQLVEQGKLGLDDDVRKYVPEFPEKDETITVRQLLCHQGGIVHYTNGKVVVTERKYDAEHPFADVVTALDTFKDSPLVARPGTKYSYTTHGYILLSAVVQRAGSRTFADQVLERVARPLGMESFRPDYQWEAISGRAVGYVRKGDEIARSTDTDVSWKLGGGGYLSNVADMARFGAGLIDRKLLRPETAARMWEPQKTADGKETTYGLGFQVEHKNGRLTVAHSGAQEKTRTQLIVLPHEGRAVAVMTNSEYGRPDAVAKAVLTAVGVEP